MLTPVVTENGELSRRVLADFLALPNLARLATASISSHRPHVVPVWYLWDGTSVWVSSYSSTRKVRDLRGNPHCSIAIDEATSGWDFRGVIFEGEAELVVEPRQFVHELTTRIYSRYLGEEGVLDPAPQEWIYDPQNLLIKLSPARTHTWFSRQVV